MAQATFVFDAQDLYDLLVHYTDGECPLNGEVREIGVNPYLGRMIGVKVASPEWGDETRLLHVRYDGKHTASWAKGDEGMKWTQRAETPRSQN